MTKNKNPKPPACVGLRCAFVAALLLALPTVARAQLNENCTVSVLNRTVRVNPDGMWVLPNVPASFGQVRARATCVQNGVTTSGESEFFAVPANGSVTLPPIVMGATTQVPVSLGVSQIAESDNHYYVIDGTKYHKLYNPNIAADDRIPPHDELPSSPRKALAPVGSPRRTLLQSLKSRRTSIPVA